MTPEQISQRFHMSVWFKNKQFYIQRLLVDDNDYFFKNLFDDLMIFKFDNLDHFLSDDLFDVLYNEFELETNGFLEIETNDFFIEANDFFKIKI